MINIFKISLWVSKNYLKNVEESNFMSICVNHVCKYDETVWTNLILLTACLL